LARFCASKTNSTKKLFQAPLAALPVQARPTDAIDLADNLPWLRPADRPADKKK
jgi:hypothetical protein